MASEPKLHKTYTAEQIEAFLRFDHPSELRHGFGEMICFWHGKASLDAREIGDAIVRHRHQSGMNYFTILQRMLPTSAQRRKLLVDLANEWRLFVHLELGQSTVFSDALRAARRLAVGPGEDIEIAAVERAARLIHKLNCGDFGGSIGDGLESVVRLVLKPNPVGAFSCVTLPFERQVDVAVKAIASAESNEYDANAAAEARALAQIMFLEYAAANAQPDAGHPDCPHDEPLHDHHDGCPACDFDDVPDEAEDYDRDAPNVFITIARSGFVASEQITAEAKQAGFAPAEPVWDEEGDFVEEVVFVKSLDVAFGIYADVRVSFSEESRGLDIWYSESKHSNCFELGYDTFDISGMEIDGLFAKIDKFAAKRVREFRTLDAAGPDRSMPVLVGSSRAGAILYGED